MLARTCLVLPAIALTIGILYPFLLGAMYAFQNYRANRPDSTRWVGFDNFQDIFSDPGFYQTALLTAEFAIAATVVETLLGIGVALLLARSSVVSRLLERLLIVPLMIAPVIAAIIWRLMMLPTVGVLNYLLSPFGIRPEWTGSARWALFSIILVDVWTYTPFVALLVLAGLRSLPRAPFEAAAVEGASFWYTFRNLTLPMLWPYILVAVIFRFMDSLKIFDIIQVLTQGGPGDATMALQVRAFERGDHLFPVFAGIDLYAHFVDCGVHRDAWSHRCPESSSGSRCWSLTLGTRRKRGGSTGNSCDCWPPCPHNP